MVSYPAYIADGLTEAAKLLEAERGESTCRENFLPEEAVAAGKAIAKAYRPKAEEAQRKASGGDRRSVSAKNQDRGNSPKLKQDEFSRTSAVAAKAVGMDRREEDTKKNTQARVASLLGVARSTVEEWFRKIGSNDKVVNTSATFGGAERPDSRVKVLPKQRPALAKRIEAGERGNDVDEIVFRTVPSYFCPDCQAETTIHPCPACCARTARDVRLARMRRGVALRVSAPRRQKRGRAKRGAD